MDVKNKRVLVLGMARSGVAAAKLLANKGAIVTISDMKTEESFGGALDELKALGCIFALGEGPQRVLAQQDMMILSPGIPVAKPFVQEAIAGGVEVIGELELGARMMRGGLCAITGTNGKTTTTTLVGELFRATGRPTHVVGNIGYPITADAGEMTDDDLTVAEVSSYQCETISTFHPHVGAVLNITEDHIARHGSMEAYIGMKRRIFANQTAEDWAVFNDDDPTCHEMAKGLAARIAWFSRTQKVDCGAWVKDGVIVLNLDGEEKAICRADEVYIPGPHNLENALAAVAIAGAMGVKPELMAPVLKTFQGVEHRIETVRVLHGVTFINDSKGTNVDSTQKAIATMTKPTVLILGGSDKGTSFEPLAQTIIAAPQITHCVLIGDTAEKIKAALDNAGYTAVTMAGYDFDLCLKQCCELAVEGGCVLLSPACASFDMFKDFEDRGRIFKEKVMALQ
ncbi:MAG: UDP-N-acetylmuramoyl-L-alanine--D-glutamate ligase [Candidatus Ventricola sp.]